MVLRRFSLRTRQDRILGSFIGGAVGDALGYTTEFMTLGDIKEEYGPNGLTFYDTWRSEEIPLWSKDGEGIVGYRRGPREALFSDDTQMSEALLKGLLQSPDLNDLESTMRFVAKEFVQWLKNPIGGHRAPGGACRNGCTMLSVGVPWHSAGGPEAGGCGSVMRAHPCAFVYDHDRAVLAAVAQSRMTHNHPLALAACAAFASGVSDNLSGTYPVHSVLERMISAAAQYNANTAEMLKTAVSTKLSYAEFSDKFRGWAGHEALANAVYLFARYPDEFLKPVLMAVNTPGDSDSLASITGALIGARVGLKGIPKKYTTPLERVNDLMQLAKKVVDV